MEENLGEFDGLDVWLSNWKPEPLQYVAVFDPTTGKINAVGPNTAFANEEHKIAIDQDIAEMIIEGRINAETCSVDVTGDELILSETRAVYKIDDVLHRVVEIHHADFNSPNIYITYENKQLTVELSEEYGGTYAVENAKKKRVNWAGSTDMNFLITDYNDPNVLYKTFSVKISELEGDKFVLDIELPEKFSIYTRRLFKNYVIEIK